MIQIFVKIYRIYHFFRVFHGIILRWRWAQDSSGGDRVDEEIQLEKFKAQIENDMHCSIGYSVISMSNSHTVWS